jgi:hypothetical protein
MIKHLHIPVTLNQSIVNDFMGNLHTAGSFAGMAGKH